VKFLHSPYFFVKVNRFKHTQLPLCGVLFLCRFFNTLAMSVFRFLTEQRCYVIGQV